MRRLGLNIASNYAYLGARLAYLAFVTPYIIDRRGTEVFGAWAIVLSVIGYVRLLELGVGLTTQRFVAAASTTDERRAVVATSITVLSLSALLGMATGLGMAALAPGLFGDVAELPEALAIAGVATGLAIPLNTFGEALFGLQRIVARNAVQVARSVFAAAGIVVAIEAGGGLAELVLASLSAELAVLLAQAVFCVARFEELRPAFASVDRERLRRLGSFGVAVLGLTVASQLAFYSDGLVIGAALSAAAVGVYSVASRLAEAARLLLGQFSDVFLPVFAELDSAARIDRSQRVFMAGTRATVVLGFPVVALLVGLGEPIIELWVGAGFDASWTPLALLAGSLVFGAPLRFGVLWAIGAARHHRVALYAILDALANVALSVVLVGPLGIDGVALATFVALAVSNGWIIPRLICRELGLPLWGSYLRPLAAGVAALAPPTVLAYLFLAPALEAARPALVTLACAAFLVVTGVVAALAVLDRRDWRGVLTRLRASGLRPQEN